VSAVREIRDGIGLPVRLGELDGLDREALPRVARVVEDDSFLANGPPDLDPTIEDLETVLDDAW